MDFSKFVKFGGHTFNLLQNKDLLGLYGIVKPSLMNQLKNMWVSPSSQNANTQQGSNSAGIAPPIPYSYPIPIDSPHWRPPVYYRPYGHPYGGNFFPVGYPRITGYAPKRRP
ncbi:hypothetical protein [Effusibacillus dendaii]|uniref:hypothetical protein n=1 Tax=Effusibacillus dendaii TaxID=2743772 RepID=UPI00190C8FC3|nr:hypothetical protein [Effusibacillus dendaii]